MAKKGSGLILVKAPSAALKKALVAFLDMQGLNGRELSEEEVEDLGLLMMMTGVDRTKKVSRDVIMRKLEH